ncbi:hypothetical protein JCM5353_001761 [Sporobolomyces roseus]
MLRPRHLRSLVHPHNTQSYLIHRRKATRASPTPPLAHPIPPKIPQLSDLTPSPYRLAFRSLPYASPTQILFPSTSLQFTHSNPIFSLRCFPSPNSRPTNLPPRPPRPKTLLPFPPPSLISTTSPSSQPFLTPSELRDRTVKLKYSKKPYTMDLTIFCSKKKVHKSAVIRERCKRRLREAVRLVVTRGAANKGGEVGLSEEDVRKLGPRKWLLPGFHYIANVTLEIYRVPLETLVEEMRKALKTLRRKAEEGTLAKELDKIPIPLPDQIRADDEEETR